MLFVILVNLHFYFDSLNENQCFAVFHVTNADGYIDQILLGIKDYSLHTQKECRFGQRHGLQNLTLTSYFYKNIDRKVIYLYFYESIFQDKSIHTIFVF